jgi:hypothetical protein
MTPRILLQLFACLIGGISPLAFAAQQTVTLNQGWNTISFPFLPTNAALSSVFANVIAQNRLISVFSYEYENWPSEGAWKRFYPGQPSDRSWINTLTTLKPMQGYWANLTFGLPVSITVTGALNAPIQVGLEQGWNLVGLGNGQDVFWADAFGSSAGALTSLFSFDYPTYSFKGFSNPLFAHADINGDGTTAPNEFGWTYTFEAGQFRNIKASQACWIKVNSPLTIGPIMEVEVESDVDSFPPEAFTNSWFQPGIDTDINGNGLLDYGFTRVDPFNGLPQIDPYGNPYVNTQDTIWFRVPTSAGYSNLVNLRQDITVLNVGNGGYLYYEVENNIPWLSITPTSGSLAPSVRGQTLKLLADMTGLPIGVSSGTIRVHSNGGEKAYNVKLSVPELDGIYAGDVTITNMQSRSAFPMNWPFELVLNLRGTSTLHATNSPHFSSNIYLTNSGTLNQFDLTGAQTLQPNDPRNPFGILLQRTVHFRGARVDPTAGFGAGNNLGLFGLYEDWITGLPGGTIQLSGLFSLAAKTRKEGLEEP